ncbi:unnamed protein product [Phytophthora lilii]|uniref:Unnamed protein product n=1 Tax=Phytophthora lilii TaxID=2077276 RepID=A0A9W6WG43_9STRA|nr:unnamed protein product [Phytophthora lilii]
MYNDASTARESRKTEPQDTSRKLLDAAPKEDMSNNSSSNIDERGDEYSSVMSTTVTYAEDLEELIRAEQLNRVALIKQITSEREQVGAALTSAFSTIVIVFIHTDHLCM